MIIKPLVLRDEYLYLFPAMHTFLPLDPEYEPPTDDEVDLLIEVCLEAPKIKMYINRGPISDCDNVSLYSSAEVHYYWANEMKKLVACPYGRAQGYKFRGMVGGHCLNTCRTESGIWFIDFDAGGRKWKASSENDSIFAVELS